MFSHLFSQGIPMNSQSLAFRDPALAAVLGIGPDGSNFGSEYGVDYGMDAGADFGYGTFGAGGPPGPPPPPLPPGTPAGAIAIPMEYQIHTPGFQRPGFQWQYHGGVGYHHPHHQRHMHHPHHPHHYPQPAPIPQEMVQAWHHHHHRRGITEQ